MAASIRKLIFNRALNKNVRSPTSLSISLHFFSSQSQTPTHLDININPRVYDVLMNKHNFPSSFASRVASELTAVKNPERVDSVLSFLESSGFSNAQLQKTLTYKPRFLWSSLEGTIKPKIKRFQEEGFSSGDISKIISSNPKILHMSLNNSIIPTLSVFKALLGSNSAVVTVVRKCPRLFVLKTRVVANVEFLKSIGVSMDRIRIILISFPAAFGSNSEVIRASADKAKEMGLTASMKAFLYAIPTLASMTNKSFNLKLQAFRDMGFSESHISSMFMKEPRVFIGSIEKTKDITEALVATGRFDISDIAGYPSSLMFSFEKRYEPRLGLLRILESRNLIQTWPALSSLCVYTDAVFFKKFVSPHLDQLSDVDISMFCALDKVKINP